MHSFWVIPGHKKLNYLLSGHSSKLPSKYPSVVSTSCSPDFIRCSGMEQPDLQNLASLCTELLPPRQLSHLLLTARNQPNSQALSKSTNSNPIFLPKKAP